MHETLLRDIGLTENEAKVYLALIKHGELTSSSIVRRAEVSSGKVYETLDKLHAKGLVSTTQISGVKHFATTKPEALLAYVEEQKIALEKKQQHIADILPSLLSMQTKNAQEVSVNLLVGERSIRPLVEEIFSKTKFVAAMGLRGSKQSHYNNFWYSLIAPALERKVKMQLLFSENTSDHYNKYLKNPAVEVRYLPSITPVALDVVDDHVLIFSYEAGISCVHIKSAAIAASFRSFFDSLWKGAK